MRASARLVIGVGGGLVAAAVASRLPAHALPVDRDATITCPPRDEPLQCTETHLNEVTPNPDGKVCTTRADCAPGEFCGAGTCRGIDGEMVTLCIDSFWIEGSACSDLEAVSLYVRAYHSPSYVAFSNYIEQNSKNACDVAPVAYCESVRLTDLVDSLLLIRRAVGGTSPGDMAARTDEIIAGEQVFLEWLDSGCRRLGPGLQEGNKTVVLGEASLWYP